MEKKKKKQEQEEEKITEGYIPPHIRERMAEMKKQKETKDK